MKDLFVSVLKYGWPLIFLGALVVGAFYLFASIVANDKEVP